MPDAFCLLATGYCQKYQMFRKFQSSAYLPGFCFEYSKTLFIFALQYDYMNNYTTIAFYFFYFFYFWKT